jgi:hypothetical protein
MGSNHQQILQINKYFIVKPIHPQPHLHLKIDGYGYLVLNNVNIDEYLINIIKFTIYKIMNEEREIESKRPSLYI